ncbi:MAG: precorrin-3B C(17)-methyltransferase [Nitrospirae bacterium]|nr:precorrin-3B C(17)-methyltransferase [Nitrospirota bacterium]
MDTGNKTEHRIQNTEHRAQREKLKTVVFYITDNGLKLSQRLKGLYPYARVLKFKSETVSELWDKSRGLIFIMATGIVVRTIAPLIKDKKTDPAIVVLSENGKFVISLLSGHGGGANEIVREIADFLGGEAVITTASDVNNLPSIDLWAEENKLIIEDHKMIPQISTQLLNNGALRVYSEIEIKLPEEFLKVNEPSYADVLITNKVHIRTKNPEPGTQIYLRPRNLVIGIGCNRGTSADEIEDVVTNILKENNLSSSSIRSIATIDKKGNEPGLITFARKHSFEMNTFTPDELNAVRGILRSESAFKATGANAVAEPAALLASGTDKLLIPKQKIGNVTMAVAVKKSEVSPPRFAERSQGSQKSNSKPRTQNSKLYIIGTGPGNTEHITPYAQDAIKKSDVIVGYGTYLDLIPELIKDKIVVSTGMTQEIDRCKKAVELAMMGKTVSVISGGDPGIYAMAGLVFEILRGQGAKGSSNQSVSKSLESLKLSVEVIPGISALNACAAKLGAPLMHDFTCISLSDRLTPWKLIEKRIEAASGADFVIILYNPKSKGRPEHINKARGIILKYRSPQTPVGIVKAAMRDNEKIVITNLKNMLDHNIDMQCTVIIGNSQTFIWDGWMVTRRGYGSKFKILR